MGVEEFLKNVCLTYCLEHVEEACGGKKEPKRATVPVSSQPEELVRKATEKAKARIELKTGKKFGPKELLDGPLILDEQSINCLNSIKRENRYIPNNRIILAAIKLGLNSLNLAMDLERQRFKD
ncbi:hypothetical protein MSMTP_0921 [Methanosarcina sp. MTP4]|nr:hypothetical protein MSMTP_0921 [Methanosarcina sp. MTP4]